MFYYEYKTRRGPVRIIPNPRTGYYEVVYNDEGLGSYNSPIMAADDVGLNTTFSPSNGADFEALGVPYDLAEWDKHPIGG